jgi:predicted HAD superfamily Cof-like phosphohydrolase
MNQEKSKQQMVKEWMEMFGQECPESPRIPEAGVKALRYNLIEEELVEFGGALLAEDVVRTADALGDILYVVYGAAVSCGISPGQMDEILQAIHKANLGKFWTGKEVEESQDSLTRGSYTVQKFKENQFNLGFCESRNIVVKNFLGKVVKPPSFVGPEAEIAKILGVEYPPPKSSAP